MQTDGYVRVQDHRHQEMCVISVLIGEPHGMIVERVSEEVSE